LREREGEGEGEGSDSRRGAGRWVTAGRPGDTRQRQRSRGRDRDRDRDRDHPSLSQPPVGPHIREISRREGRPSKRRDLCKRKETMPGRPGRAGPSTHTEWRGKGPYPSPPNVSAYNERIPHEGLRAGPWSPTRTTPYATGPSPTSGAGRRAERAERGGAGRGGGPGRRVTRTEEGLATEKEQKGRRGTARDHLSLSLSSLLRLRLPLRRSRLGRPAGG